MNIKKGSKTAMFFDLLGVKETSLCKAFAFTLAKEPAAFCAVMRDVFGIKYANWQHDKSEINLETRYEDIGRTDIEIKFSNYHIIIEAKVGQNSVSKEQNEKYKDCFKSYEGTNKILCFVTENLSPNRDLNLKDVKVVYRSWSDIVEVLERIAKKTKGLIKDFLYYYEGAYKMQHIKEVLVQDLGLKSEIERFEDNHVYKCKPQVGTPLYFAPYFTKSAEGSRKDGIYCFAEVCGVVTGKANEIPEDLLKAFAKKYSDSKHEQEDIIQKWKNGLNGCNNSEENSYYFLGEFVNFNKPFRKDGGNKTGRGKGWIAAMISRNRCIPFKEFIRRMDDR